MTYEGEAIGKKVGRTHPTASTSEESANEGVKITAE